MKYKILFGLLCFVVLSTAVSAATVTVSSVDLLSENPHEKNLYSISIKVSYSIGDASSCQALVSTLPSGWLVRDGYQGGTYKTIPCSGTSTTFDIMPTDLTTPTIAVEVKGDSTSATKTMTDSVSVKNQPVMDLTTSLSSTSVTKDSSITLNYIVQNTGNPADTAPTESAVLTIDSTRGFVTFPGGATTLTVGTGTIDPGESVSDSTTLSISSSASSNSINYTITALASNTVQTSVDSGTLSCTDCVVSGDGDGGGGGGGGIPPATTTTPSVTQIWDSMSAATPTEMKINNEEIGITKLRIEVYNDTTNVEVIVEKLAAKPVDVKPILKKVYKYFELTKKNLDDPNVKSLDIDFKVEKSWILENNIDESTVVLMRFVDDKWDELPTFRKGSDAINYHYKTTSPGFSYFAIAAKEKAAEIEIAEEKPPEKEVTPPTASIPKVPEEEKTVLNRVIIFGGIICLIVLAVILFKLRKKGRKTRKIK